MTKCIIHVTQTGKHAEKQTQTIDYEVEQSRTQAVLELTIYK